MSKYWDEQLVQGVGLHSTSRIDQLLFDFAIDTYIMGPIVRDDSSREKYFFSVQVRCFLE